MSEEVFITVIINCHPNELTSCLSAAEKFQASSLKESGCLSFKITRTLEDPNRLILFEKYKNQEAFEFHQEKPYTSEFGSTVEAQYAKDIKFHMSKEII